MKHCVIRKGIFDRWVIFHPYHNMRAWSGSHWAPCDIDGTPYHTQVCNFETKQEARDYCRENGLKPLTSQVGTMDEIPDLYEVARDICHKRGLPWTDPRTGVTYPPPKEGTHD